MLPTNTVKVAQFANALYGIKLGSATDTWVARDITNAGGNINAVFNAYFTYSFGTEAAATTAARVVNNLNIIAGTNGLVAADVTLAVDYVKALLTAAAGTKTQGQVMAQLTQDYAALASSNPYYAASVAWKVTIASSVAYTATNIVDAAVVAGEVGGTTFTLTTGADLFTGGAGNDTFNALTINAVGTDATTLSSFDAIDGGAGNDTLNIYSDNAANFNDTFPATTTVTNVETVNILNSNAAAGVFGDASKYVGVTALNQAGFAENVTKLAATTTAGFKNLTAATAGNLTVTAATAATTASIALTGVKGDAVSNTAELNVAGAALTSVTVSGTIAQTDTGAGDPAANLALIVTVALDAQSATVNTAVKTTLTIDNDGASAKDLTSVDASASAGAIKYTNAADTVATIKTGAGADEVTIITATLKDDTTTTAVETISALLETGAGKDKIIINTTGTGTTTVNAGDGDDTVTLTGNGTGVLTVNLGAGNDTFKGAGAVSGTDVINAGDGTDTLLLNMVGSANIGAFSSFETFDAAALAKTLDADILATKNTVTEFVATADVGASAILTNVGAGVGYRVTGDTTVANTLTLTQKTAGALAVTLDIDEAADTAANLDSGAKTNVDAGVVASNATSIKAVFDSSFKDAAVDASDNLTNLTITGTKATSLEVVSGGAFAINDLVYIYGKATASSAADGLLTSVTVSGDRAINLAFSDGTNDAESNIAVNASSLTGKLTFSTADLKTESAANTFNGGLLTLGSGADVITIVQGAAISGLTKGTIEDAAAQGTFDVLSTGGSVAQAADDVSTSDPVSVKDGKLTFNGAGPSTLAAAIALVDTQLADADAGEAVVFEYIGSSYIFVDAATDLVIKLTGVTGLTGLDEVGSSNTLYVF